MLIFCLRSVDTIAALSVSQNRYVPPALLMHFSSIARSRRPPDVMREPMCGANHFPGSSTTSEVVSKDSSPEKTFIFAASASLGVATTNMVEAARIGRQTANGPESRKKHAITARRNALAQHAWKPSDQPD